MTLEAEATRITHLFERVEAVEAVADATNVLEDQRRALREVARQALIECDPVRVPIAARLLGFSEKTVRAWIDDGLLTLAEGSSARTLLDPERLHEVVHIVRELKARGTDRNFIDAIWYRLGDQMLLDREDLTESINQTRQGDGKVVRSGGKPMPLEHGKFVGRGGSSPANAR